MAAAWRGGAHLEAGGAAASGGSFDGPGTDADWLAASWSGACSRRQHSGPGCPGAGAGGSELAGAASSEPTCAGAARGGGNSSGIAAGLNVLLATRCLPLLAADPASGALGARAGSSRTLASCTAGIGSVGRGAGAGSPAVGDVQALLAALGAAYRAMAAAGHTHGALTRHVYACAFWQNGCHCEAQAPRIACADGPALMQQCSSCGTGRCNNGLSAPARKVILLYHDRCAAAASRRCCCMCRARGCWR